MGLLSAARAANQAKKLRELKAVNTARETLNTASKMTEATAEGRQMVGAAKRAVKKGVDPYNTSRDFAKSYIPPMSSTRPVAGLSDNDKMYLLGKSKGMDPYNTASSYRRAGQVVGAQSAKPVSGSPGAGPRKQSSGFADFFKGGTDPYNSGSSGSPSYAEQAAKAKKKRK